MTRAELIAALEKLTGPSREMDARIAAVAGIASRSRRDGRGKSKGREWLMDSHGGVETWSHHPPPFTSSIDIALTLGRDERERRSILAAIYDNANETYPISRCINFGCAWALKARLSSTENTAHEG